MKSYSYLFVIPLFFIGCGSEGSSSSGSSSTSSSVTMSMTLQDENGSAGSSLIREAGVATCSDSSPSGDICLAPDNYTVGCSKIEFLLCDQDSDGTGDDCDPNGDGDVESSDIDSATTIYNAPNTVAGRAFDLGTGTTLTSSEMESSITAGIFDGLRFTVTYLQQTLAAADVTVTGVTGDLQYRICTKNGACREAVDDATATDNTVAGDVLVNLGDGAGWQWVENDADEDGDGDMFSLTRPADPVVDSGFASMGGEDGPRGSAAGGFLPLVANDSGAITISSGKTYSVTATFTIGGAFAFTDTDSDNIFEPENTGESGNPEKPQEIGFTATEQ